MKFYDAEKTNGKMKLSLLWKNCMNYLFLIYHFYLPYNFISINLLHPECIGESNNSLKLIEWTHNEKLWLLTGWSISHKLTQKRFCIQDWHNVSVSSSRYNSLQHQCNVFKPLKIDGKCTFLQFFSKIIFDYTYPFVIQRDAKFFMPWICFTAGI